MARCKIEGIVHDIAGNVLANAKVFVWETGTTTPVADLFLADAGGSAQGYLLTGANGAYEGWVTTRRYVDLRCTDNGGLSYYPSDPTVRIPFTAFTKSKVPVAESPTDDATEDTTLATVVAGLAGHLADTTDAHDASAVSVVPFGSVASTNVQAALEELLNENAAPPTTVAVRYAAPWGDDAKDGTTWAKAKQYVMSAYDALPAAGGTVYFAENTACTATADQGIWLAGSTDPNYASLPAGWRQKKSVSTFIGVGTIQGWKGPQASLLGGSTSNAAKPVVALSEAFVMSVENVYLGAKKRPVRLGMNSNGVTGNTSGNTYWSNVTAHAYDATSGPIYTLESANDTCFWHHFEWMAGYSNSAATIDSDQRRWMLCTGAYLINLHHSIMHFGGMKYTTPNVSWNINLKDISMESDFSNPTQPILDLFGSQTAGHAYVEFAATYDAPGTAGVIRNNTLPAECLVVNGIGEAGHYAVLGPHTSLGFQRVTPGSLAAMRSYGPQRWRDVARRGFGLTMEPPVLNRANHSPASWTGRSHGSYPTGGNATVTTVTGPDGVPNSAGRLTFAGPGIGNREMKYTATLAAGDFVVFGIWQQKVTGTDVNSPYLGIIGGVDAFEGSKDLLNVYSGASSSFITTEATARDNYDARQWQWCVAIARMTTIGTNPCSLVGTIGVLAGETYDFFGPTLLHFPAASWTAEQVANYVDGMNSTPYMPNLFGESGGGLVTTQFGQKLVAPGGVVAALNQDVGAASGGIAAMTLGSFLAYNSAAGQYYRLLAAGVNPWDMMMRTQSGTGDTWALRNGSNSHIEAREGADTETSLLVRRNVGGSFTLQRVSMGAADSGGAGFKLLRVPN